MQALRRRRVDSRSCGHVVAGAAGYRRPGVWVWCSCGYLFSGDAVVECPGAAARSWMAVGHDRLGLMAWWPYAVVAWAGAVRVRSRSDSGATSVGRRRGDGEPDPDRWRHWTARCVPQGPQRGGRPRDLASMRARGRVRRGVSGAGTPRGGRGRRADRTARGQASGVGGTAAGRTGACRVGRSGGAPCVGRRPSRRGQGEERDP